ncbi:MAG: hypothetical protein RRZ65_09285 [Tannerellaceae bacterium]
MKTQNVLLGIVFLLFGSSCKENTILEKKRVYTPVMLYFSTIEDYLMSANDIPDFVNYPNDWVRWGLKGKVKTVTDKTFHQFSLDFYEDGRLQEVNFISSGVGGTKEGQQTLFHYNDSSRLQSVGVANSFLYNGKNHHFAEWVGDKITAYTPSGKIEKRVYKQINKEKIAYVKQYNYDENGICRTMSLADESPNKSTKLFQVTADGSGRVSDIYIPNLRIPCRLTIGERHIVPVYDEEDRMIGTKEMNIPHNNEAYEMDSIRVENHYKYNDNGDIVEWRYQDIVYPDNRPNDFICTFTYVYDEQGNWTSKTVTGGIVYLHSVLNNYYRGAYSIERVQNEKGESLGQVVFTRNIIYYDDNR